MYRKMNPSCPMGRKEDSNDMRNRDPFMPWNDPMDRSDPFKVYNDPMNRDDPFAPWNDPLSNENDYKHWCDKNHVPRRDR